MKKIAIRGSAFAIGQQLGAFGREAWHQQLKATRLWQTVTAMQASGQLQAMRAAVMADYPLIWQELEGLAAGLGASVEEVFAWNCRGDLVTSTSDGCTTVAGSNGAGQWVIAHNEDGFPQLRADCVLVQVTPDDGIGFTSFAYPGSICGHTFAVNDCGVVITVNNIRAQHRPAGLPRQILARAALNARQLDEAVTILTSSPRGGAFHHMLGQRGDPRILSVEATGSGCSVTQINGCAGHANHLIHPQLAEVQQRITDSSASRQRRIDEQLSGLTALSADAALALLSDQHDAMLPVYRLAADDPDEENTLATAIFTLSDQRVDWQVFGLDRLQAVQQGSVA